MLKINKNYKKHLEKLVKAFNFKVKISKKLKLNQKNKYNLMIDYLKVN